MTTETLPPPSVFGTTPPVEPTPDAPPTDPREGAVAALAAAEAHLAEVKGSITAATAAKAAAQAIIDKAKPSILRAEAKVDIAKADLLDFGPIPTVKTDNAEIFTKVLEVLQGADHQMTVDEIHKAIGATTSRDNLNTYLSRWAKTGVILKGEKNNPLEPARFYAPVANGTAPAPTDASNLFGAVAPPAAGTALPEEFPARLVLEEAGITTKEQLAGKTAADLTTIKGVGKATAAAILDALEAA